jgi:hypothetical protein
LRVEYISDIYLLTATLAHGELIGDWRRSDNSEVGTWKARRRESSFVRQRRWLNSTNGVAATSAAIRSARKVLARIGNAHRGRSAVWPLSLIESQHTAAKKVDHDIE